MYWALPYDKLFDSLFRLENANFICTGKYQCMDDPIFLWYGSSQASKSADNYNVTKLLNPNRQEFFRNWHSPCSAPLDPPYFPPKVPTPVRIHGSNGTITRSTRVVILRHNPLASYTSIHTIISYPREWPRLCECECFLRDWFNSRARSFIQDRNKSIKISHIFVGSDFVCLTLVWNECFRLTVFLPVGAIN